MLFFAITGLVNAIGSLLLGFFVYFQNRKNNINQVFCWLCITITVWSFYYFLWQIAEVENLALFWSKILMIGAILIPITYFHFVVNFLDLKGRHLKFLYFGYFLAYLFILANSADLLVKGIAKEMFFNFWPKAGPLYPYFLLMFFGYIVYGCILLYKTHQETNDINKKVQIKFLLIAAIVGFLGGATNYPLWYGIPLLPIGNALVILFPILTTYAIARHHLFEIKVIVTELLVGFIALILLIQAIIAPNTTAKLSGFFLLFIFSIVGIMLIRGVIKEVKYREQLQEAYQQLQKLDSAKSEFMSIASHQLRTPLTVIKGYISMILDRTYGEPSKKIEDVLKKIFTSNERLIRLVNDLLNVSRIEMGKTEMECTVVSIESIVSGVIEELKFESKRKKIYLREEKPEQPLPHICIDADKIRQALLNVIDNALKYTRKGGVLVKISQLDSKVKIEVKDTGEGLTKDELGRLFNTFTRGSAGTRLFTEGVGLGLHIAKRFVEMNQGKIWAESEGPKKGSTFYIELPISQK